MLEDDVAWMVEATNTLTGGGDSVLLGEDMLSEGGWGRWREDDLISSLVPGYAYVNRRGSSVVVRLLLKDSSAPHSFIVLESCTALGDDALATEGLIHATCDAWHKADVLAVIIRQ